MKRKFLFAITVMLLAPAFTHAEVIINEIMYDLDGTDTGHEWVELYNDGDVSVTLSGGAKGWRFSDGSNHYLATTPASGSMTIAPGGYAILADSADTFLADHAGILGNVIESVMGLKNTEGVVKILDESGSEVDSVSYSSNQGANDDGNSLQKTSSGWIAAIPTPGKENATDGESGGTILSDEGDPVLDENIPNLEVVYKISSKIMASTTKAVVGIPLSFSTTTLGHSRERLYRGRWSWNFGDDTSLEIFEDKGPISHTYFYTGEYVVYLEYRDNIFETSPIDAMDKVVINVIAPSVAISEISYDEKGGVTISNSSGMDMDLANWTLGSGQTKYVFPKNSIILSGKKITVVGKSLGLDIKIGQAVALFHPDGTFVSVYPAAPKATASVSKISSKPKVTPAVEAVPATIPQEIIPKADSEIPVEELSANVFYAKDSPKSSGRGWIYGGFAALTIIGATTALYLRRKKSALARTEADEFEITE